MAKVNRWLTLTISPRSPGNFQIVLKDSTTRSVEGKRHSESDAGVDPFAAKAVPEALGLMFKEFEQSIAKEDKDDLFTEAKKKATTLDS